MFDMETRDPDDVLTLCLAASHPAVELVAVTINPGTPAQGAVVASVLERLGVTVPLGARNAVSPANAVSEFHTRWLGPLAPAPPMADAVDVLAAALTHDTSLLTGAPLHSLRRLLRERPAVTVARWVAQGGFVGESLVPEAQRLPKFAGRELCESHNFGVDSRATLAALASPRLMRRELVGKNVTHGLAWDRALQDHLWTRSDLTPGARLAREAMDVFLAEAPDGKLLHDPLALAAVIEPDVFTWVEVEVIHEGGSWGARPAASTGTFAAVAVDHARALDTLFASNPGDRR